MVGENFSKVPEVFNEAQVSLSDRIHHWGFIENKNEYYGLLKTAHVAVSTAIHEFFGVSMYVLFQNTLIDEYLKYCICIPG